MAPVTPITRTKGARVAGANPHPAGGASVARLLNIEADGLLKVEFDSGEFACVAWLEQGLFPAIELTLGDTLLVLRDAGNGQGVALGRIGRYVDPGQQARLAIRSTESLSLQCGESSIDLRADGKVMIRGDDVLVRAKGTKRIRAGTVSIN